MNLIPKCEYILNIDKCKYPIIIYKIQKPCRAYNLNSQIKQIKKVKERYECFKTTVKSKHGD